MDLPEDCLRLWVADDGESWLRIERDGAMVRTTAWRGGRVHADRRETTWHPRDPGKSASPVASERLDWLSAELGVTNLGPTYRLYVAVENSDPALYGGKRWRPVAPEDDVAAVRLLPELGASYYEAVLGAWDDYVEDINAGEDWVLPLSTWRPASAEEAAAAPERLR